MGPQIFAAGLEREVSYVKFCRHFSFSNPLMLWKLGLVSRSQVQGRMTSLRWDATHPALWLSARAAPNQVENNLTLSSAERRRFAARTGATISVAREQDLTGRSMTKIAAQRKSISLRP